MKTNLGPEDLGDLLEQPLIGVLATRRPDDTTLLSPVWWDWRDGRFSIWADSEQNGKVRHIRRDPRVSFVVANQDWPYRGLEVRGTATVTTEDFYGVLGRTARHFMGPDAEARMVASTPPGVVIRIEPDVVRGWEYVDEA
jgi:PPOX class probable F420-dependent enzyme